MHWPRTLAAKGPCPLASEHLRMRSAEARAGRLHCFVLDCSGSMLDGRRLALAKGVLLRLLQQAHRGRGRVALVCFAAGRAELRLAPTAARAWNEAWVRRIGGGGGTPLALALRRAGELLARAARACPAERRWLWLLTDGRSAEAPPRPAAADRIVVVDFEHVDDRGRLALGRARRLADGWQADWLSAARWVG